MKMHIIYKLMNINKHIGEPIEADEAPSKQIPVGNETPKSTSEHWSHEFEVEADLPEPKSPKIEASKSTDLQPSSSKSQEENDSEQTKIFRALDLSKNTMAVKKHELVPENCNQLDLASLAQYIKVLLNEQHNYLPPPSDLIKNCQDIVKCLSRSSGKEERLWEHLQVIEEFLLRMVHTVHTSTRNEIIKTVLEHLYTLVSDPQSDACPATSVVLIVFDGLHDEEVLSSARWLVQKDQNGPAGAGLRASLSCLYRWTHEWNGTPLLGNWVSAYIKALEEIERYDILMEVSLENLTDLFITLEAPTASRQSSADVVFHILASLRESVEALDRIASHVGRILMHLAADSGAWSRQMLQNVVDIISAMIDYHTEKLKSDAQVQFREKYLHVILELERYMVSRDCRYIQLPAWHGGEVCLPTSTSDHPPLRKVGLINLGNTCYMNSVMQALLFTRRFSNHVVLRMLNTPYWSPMGLMFAKMMHSVSTKLNPDEFFALVKPPFFHNGNQHDSSEFLGYLLELLSSYEHVRDINYDYTRPTELQRGVYYQRALTYGSAHASPTYSYASDYDSDASRRSVSPRPGSSAAAGGAAGAGGGGGAGAGSSNGLKRSSPERAESMMPLKKRRHYVDARERESPSLRRQSVVDSMFGGVLLTRVQCSTCSTSSISRDVFRDLQLAFPEKPDGWQYTVQALLEYYCSLEIMTGENRYHCPSCGCLQEAEKNVIIESTPKILVLVLKNFKFDQKLQMQKKALHSMYHNMTVTLPTVRSQTNATYYMYAAVVHAGTSLDSGHYYTLALDGGQWYMYNDDTVTTAHEAQLNKLERGNTPYILFYRRKDVEEGAAPGMEELPPQVQQAVLAHNKHCVDAVRNKRLNCP